MMKKSARNKYIASGLILVVLIAAFLFYLFANDSLIYISSVTLEDKEGNKIVLEDEESIDFYISITENASLFTELPLDPSTYRVLNVTYSKMSDLKYTYYLTDNSRNCFFKTPDGELYNLNRTMGEALLAREEMFFAYDAAYPTPPVITVGEKKYTPAVTDFTWKYRTATGKFLDSRALTPTDVKTFDMIFPEQLDVTFPVTPDYLETHVYRIEADGTEIEVTGREDFNADTTLRYVYKANWYEVPDCKYYGQVEYTFFIRYKTVVSAAMTPCLSDDPHAAAVSPGGTVFIRLFNAANKEVSFDAGDLAPAPTFIGTGDTRYLLLAVPAAAAEGTYPLHIQAGDFSLDLTLNVSKRTYREDGTLDPSRLGLTPDQYYEIFSQFCKELPTLAGASSQVPLWSGNGFISPLGADSTFSLSTHFHETMTLTGSTHAYRHDAVDLLSSSADPDILASSDGVVVFAGETEYGGNTVIIDHGLGLRTVYCHLSQIDVLAGDGVKTGNTIGKMGKTGKVTGRHLHFAAMVGDVFIDPLLLFETDADGRPLYLAYFVGLE